MGKTAGDRFTYGAKWSKFIPEYVIGPEDEAGTALLALENTLGPPHAQEYVMEMTQEVDGVIVEGEVQMHQTMVEEEDTEAEVDGEWAVEMDVQEITPEEAAVQEAAARQPPMVTPGGPLPGAGVDETAGLRSQINVLVNVDYNFCAYFRRVSMLGCMDPMKLPFSYLRDKPLVILLLVLGS